MSRYSEFEELRALLHARLKGLLSERIVTDKEYEEYNHRLVQAVDEYDLIDIRKEWDARVLKLEESKAKEENTIAEQTPEEVAAEREAIAANPYAAMFDSPKEPNYAPTKAQMDAATGQREVPVGETKTEADIELANLRAEFLDDDTNSKHVMGLIKKLQDGEIDKPLYDKLLAAYFNEWFYRTKTNSNSENSIDGDDKTR